MKQPYQRTLKVMDTATGKVTGGATVKDREISFTVLERTNGNDNQDKRGKITATLTDNGSTTTIWYAKYSQE